MLAGAAIDRSELCDSGSVHVFGNVDDATQTGTITAVYANCRTGSDVVNGQATLDIVAYDKTFGLATDETLTFTRASFVGPGMNVDLSGSIRRQIDQTAKTYTYTENFVTVDNLSRLMTKTENLLITDTYIGLLGGAYTEAIRGRVYDSVHGYADVTTTVPLSFGTLNPEYPSSGQIVLHGVNSRTAVLTALSETLFTLAVDEDGNGIYEVNVTLKWSDLGTPVASDLADTDGDGMHNSWESANGLDPHNPADANLDADGDGYSNKLEYLGGTDPRNAASAPPATGLKVTMSDFPDPVTTGTNLLYYIEVSNIAPAPASNVVITDVLPASVTFVSAAATQGSCSGTGPVTCMLANVAGFTTVEIRLIVSPATQGLITNTVTASSSSFDPDLSDNTATVTTMVGQPAAGLQDLIDAAQPGDTIIVPPGIYTGGLNYHGKNVNLRSRDGPAATTILSGTSSAVSLSGGGSITGFTITSGTVGFGVGIEVVGAGSVISGNVFDGLALGITGFSGSPLIEGNIFRNHKCGIGFSSGILTFVNNSSPRIVNNVFANNACTGINMTLPTDNTPAVLNNTFVGNRTGVHINRIVSQATEVYRNNLFVNNGSALEVESGSDADNPVWTNNLVFGNTADYVGTASLTGVNGNIAADPIFLDLAAGNYRLQPGSPAIDAGDGTAAPASDFDGLPRPKDGNGDGRAAMDIGAFEAQ